MKTPPRTRGSAQIRARTSYTARVVVLPTQHFIHTATSGGLVLLAAALLALAWANSPWAPQYHSLWEVPVGISFGSATIAHTLREWVNDALMVVFFFVVGLEVKREFLRGELSDWRRGSLPAACALGGMVVPAALYLAVNSGLPTARGWGISMATDIAFALGVLSLVGDRIPASARLFLLALAAVDDIGAILVIAIFYSGDLSLAALGAGAVLIVTMLLLRMAGVQSLLAYFLFGILFWLAILQSGVHATIAGVVLGLMTPTAPYFTNDTYAQSAKPIFHDIQEAAAQGDHDRAEALLGQIEELTAGTESPADRLIRMLHPWSSFVLLPIFALANAGVPLTATLIRQAATSPVAIGIAAGLLVGKVAGIMLFGFIAVKLGVSRLISGASWGQMAGIGVLAGIGFTVSLFIAELAFADDTVATAKVAILAASFLAGMAGYLILRLSSRARS